MAPAGSCFASSRAWRVVKLRRPRWAACLPVYPSRQGPQRSGSLRRAMPRESTFVRSLLDVCGVPEMKRKRKNESCKKLQKCYKVTETAF